MLDFPARPLTTGALDTGMDFFTTANQVLTHRLSIYGVLIMQPHAEENTHASADDNGDGSTGSMTQPCACCAALAQLRMPWMDMAMQHAPHYPYGQPGACADDRAERYDAEDDENAEKTVFFKLPFFSSKKKRKKSSAARQTAAAHQKARSSGSRHFDHSCGAETSTKKTSTASAATDNLDAAGDDAEAGITGSGALAGESDDSISDSEDGAEWNTAPTGSKPKFRLSFGLQGLAVSIFGILIPSFIFASSIFSTPKRITLVALHHPVETLIEFLLVASIPVVNFLVWSALCKNRANLSRWLVMGLGGAVGTALVVSALGFACLFFNHEDLVDTIGTDFTMGFTWLAVISLLSAVSSAYLVNRLRTSWELESSRLKVFIQAVTGMVLAMLAFVGSEYRPWCIRMAQYNAVSTSAVVRKDGLHWLRDLNPEREMRMECSDSRAAGLSGLFFPIKNGVQQQLYFTLTGTPYSFRDANAKDLSSMSDDYLSRHVVGDRVPQLGLTRSTLNGVLHANTLTSTLNWTFVVKNGSSTPQEMRAEIGLPAGAAVTGLTVWHRGEPDQADFVVSGNKIEGVNTVAGNDTPAMVTDLGHGRVLVHCYPVPREEELKVKVSMVVPLRSEKDGQASLVTPQLIASNFDLEGEHLLRLRSRTKLETSVKGLETSINAAGDSIISGALSSEQLESSPLLVSATRSQIGKTYAVLDKLAIMLRREDERAAELARLKREKLKEQQRRERERAEKEEMGQVVFMIDGSKGMPTQIQDLRKLLAEKNRRAGAGNTQKAPRIVKIKPEYAIEEISRVAAPAPHHLVVVIDGSTAMKKYSKDIAAAFARLPASIPTSIIVASQEDEKLMKAQTLQKVLPNFEKIAFSGGQDNLRAVVRGAELAGETAGSAVLWIHGPQPVINPENYIMSPYEAQPAFYELPVVAGTDTYEFFKNHSEIGPFTQVPRNGSSIAADLTDFFSRWNPNNNSCVATITQNQKLPLEVVEAGREEGREIMLLHAVRQCNDLIASRHYHRAARIATRYGFVSEVSSAYLTSNPDKTKDLDTNPDAARQAAEADNINRLTANELGEAAEAVNSSQEASATAGDRAGTAAAPMTEGATNGTIGPVGADATVIQGVNTAGTVRVNNLANLEALLNIIANLGELGALLSGLGLIVHGFMNKAVLRLGEDIELGAGGRIVLGIVLMTMGLSLPGVLNWFVASARDANLFS
jgi:hypothetical protein